MKEGKFSRPAALDQQIRKQNLSRDSKDSNSCC